MPRCEKPRDVPGTTADVCDDAVTDEFDKRFEQGAVQRLAVELVTKQRVVGTGYRVIDRSRARWHLAGARSR